MTPGHHMKFRMFALGVAATLSVAALAQTPAPSKAKEAPAAKTAPAATTTPAANQCGTMYGCQLMTDAERAEYRAKMRSLKTPEEREAFRQQHHKEMQARAKERGVTLPEMPAHAMGQGQGHMMDHRMGGPNKSPPQDQAPQPPPK